MAAGLGFLWYWRGRSFPSAAAAGNAPYAWAILLFMLVFGLLWTIGGAVKFRRYLRDSRRMKEASE